MDKISISKDEQETVIVIERNKDYATLYTSDRTWMTKMNKLIKKSPNLFDIIRDDSISTTYKFPKRLISIRSCITTKNKMQDNSLKTEQVMYVNEC